MTSAARTVLDLNTHFSEYQNPRYFLENDDECVTAAEVYSCGRQKEPLIVDAIFNTEKGNSTIVCY